MPPNEAHPPFTADQGGKATMTIDDDRKIGKGAALVVHPRDALDDMLACADF